MVLLLFAVFVADQPTSTGDFDTAEVARTGDRQQIVIAVEERLRKLVTALHFPKQIDVLLLPRSSFESRSPGIAAT
ncbi:MAG: hypothetical protein AAGJ40_18430 [Planctomycetota bacterium]